MPWLEAAAARLALALLLLAQWRRASAAVSGTASCRPPQACLHQCCAHPACSSVQNDRALTPSGGLHASCMALVQSRTMSARSTVIRPAVAIDPRNRAALHACLVSLHVLYIVVSMADVSCE
jgi:hypothetical protein